MLKIDWGVAVERCVVFYRWLHIVTVIYINEEFWIGISKTHVCT